MRINITSDARAARGFIRGFEGQMPYAAARAINATALDFQEEQRKHQHVVFTFRKPQTKAFADRGVKLKPRASKMRLEAVISMDAAAGSSKEDLFTKFERGDRKRSRKPGGRIAVPNISEARTSRSDNSKRNKRPKEFQFRQVVAKRSGFRGWSRARSGADSGSTRIFRGKGRTFMILRADGTGGIFQRTGRRGSKKTGRRGVGRRLERNEATGAMRDKNVKTLYRFTPSAKMDDRLHFEANARGVVNVTFKRHFEVYFTEAVEKARDRSGRFKAKEAA